VGDVGEPKSKSCSSIIAGDGVLVGILTAVGGLDRDRPEMLP
jgi:hypothetical protein